MPTTPKLGLAYPDLTNAADVPADVAALALGVDSKVSGFKIDIFANRPAAGKAGFIFYSIDTFTGYIDDGTAWQVLGAGKGNAYAPFFDTTLVTNQDFIDITGIPTDGAHLHIDINGRTTSGLSSVTDVFMQFNGDTGANYMSQYMSASHATQTDTEFTGLNDMLVGALPSVTADNNMFGSISLDILDYLGTIAQKSVMGTSIGRTGSVSGKGYVNQIGAWWSNTNPINAIRLLNQSPNKFISGTRVTAYVKRVS